MANSNPRCLPDADALIPISSRRSPLIINTGHERALPQRQGPGSGQRFSYMETPIDMQEPQYGAQQRFTPGEAVISEEQRLSLQSAEEEYQQRYSTRGQPQQQYTAQQITMVQIQPVHTLESAAHRSTSPYQMSEPERIHPAYFAPIADPTTTNQPRSRPGSIPPIFTSSAPLLKPQRVSTMPIRTESDEGIKKEHNVVNPAEPAPPVVGPYIPYSDANATKSPTQPIFSPTSLAGPNGAAPNLHRPGQVLHPNMTFPTSPSSKAEWQHSLCGCGSDVGTCLTGISCPCILDSRTAYRLEQRGMKKDPTDLLGFNSCNGRCGIMALFGICGLFCILPLTMHTRMRHTYHLSGSLGSDIVRACCCCCCVAIQNEREVRDREGKIRQNAGPAQTQTQYRAGVGDGMVYTPGGRLRS